MIYYTGGTVDGLNIYQNEFYNSVSSDFVGHAIWFENYIGDSVTNILIADNFFHDNYIGIRTDYALTIKGNVFKNN